MVVGGDIGSMHEKGDATTEQMPCTPNIVFRVQDTTSVSFSPAIAYLLISFSCILYAQFLPCTCLEHLRPAVDLIAPILLGGEVNLIQVRYIQDKVFIKDVMRSLCSGAIIVYAGRPHAWQRAFLVAKEASLLGHFVPKIRSPASPRPGQM